MALPPSTDYAFHSAVTSPSKKYLHLIGSRTSELFFNYFLFVVVVIACINFTSNSYSSKVESAPKPKNSHLFPLSEIVSQE